MKLPGEIRRHHEVHHLDVRHVELAAQHRRHLERVDVLIGENQTTVVGCEGEAGEEVSVLAFLGSEGSLDLLTRRQGRLRVPSTVSRNQ